MVTYRLTSKGWAAAEKGVSSKDRTAAEASRQPEDVFPKTHLCKDFILSNIPAPPNLQDFTQYLTAKLKPIGGKVRLFRDRLII
jgi:hypothetical protein